MGSIGVNERTVTVMDEYIERKALREAFDNADADVVEEYEDGGSDWGFSRQNILEVINSVPTADVAPVRHGRWLDVQETDMCVPDLKLTATKTAETCSVCKARIGFIGAKLYLFDSFCPSCGARMDGGFDNG